MIEKVKWPTFILHGEKDNIIPAHHSKTLSELCGGSVCLTISDTMDHSTFDFELEFINPLIKFFKKHNIKPHKKKSRHLMSRDSWSQFKFTRPYFSYLQTPNQKIFEYNKTSSVFEPKTHSETQVNDESMHSESTESTSPAILIPESVKPSKSKIKEKRKKILKRYRKNMVSNISEYISPQKPSLSSLIKR